MKTQILAALGENGLQQASALNAALAANNRVKYAFSLPQMALEHAHHPDQPAAKRERLAEGIDDAGLDATVSGARTEGKTCRVSSAARVLHGIEGNMRLMAAPVLAAQALASDKPGFGARLPFLLAGLPGAKDDLVDPEAISAMTQAGSGSDSLHRLVMDLHKRFNALQGSLA